MPRVYKPKPGTKKRNKSNELIIKQALDELSSSGDSIKIVAQKYGISKSVLCRYKLQEMKFRGRTALSPDTEKYIIQNLNKYTEWGYPITTMDLRHIVKNYLDSLGIQHKRFKNNLPGPDFVYGLLKRHKNNLSKSICRNKKGARAKVSPQTIKEHHSELENKEEQINLEVIAGRSGCEDEAEKYSHAQKKRKLKQLKQEYPSKSGKSGKAIGKQSNQKLLLNINKEVDIHKNFEVQEIELDSVDITQMPLNFTDNSDCIEIIIIESENDKKVDLDIQRTKNYNIEVKK